MTGGNMGRTPNEATRRQDDRRQSIDEFRGGRSRRSYRKRDEVQEGHDSYTELYDGLVDQGKIKRPDQDQLQEYTQADQSLRLHPDDIAKFNPDNTEHVARTTTELMTSAAGLLSLITNKNNEPNVIRTSSGVDEDIAKPMNNAKANKKRLKAGMLIGVYKLERLSDTDRVKFPNSSFVSTPTGPALNKHYTCLIRFVTPDYISCYVLTSKHHTGFGKLHEDDYSNHVPVFPQGSDYTLPRGASEALFTTGREYYEGAMLCFRDHPVMWNEWIAIAKGGFTAESQLRIAALALQNNHTQQHIGQLTKGLDLSKEVKEEIIGAGVPGPNWNFVLEDSTFRKVAVTSEARSSQRNATQEAASDSSPMPPVQKFPSKSKDPRGPKYFDRGPTTITNSGRQKYQRNQRSAFEGRNFQPSDANRYRDTANEIDITTTAPRGRRGGRKRPFSPDNNSQATSGPRKALKKGENYIDPDKSGSDGNQGNFDY